MSENNNPIARTKDLVIQNSAEEVLIYDLNHHHAFCLNKTSAAVWRLCDGAKSVGDIAAQISEKENSTVNDELILLALAQLSKNKLLENGQAFPDIRKGLSRRDVVRNAALASAVALPFVSLIVAPTATNAQSICGPQQSPPGTSVPSCAQPIGHPDFCQLFCANPASGGLNCCSGSATLGTCTPSGAFPGTESCSCICD